MPAEKQFTMAELAEESGVAARTIRFYIARNLLDGPVRAGRAAPYGQSHLDRLQQIRQLQERGLTLSEITHELGADRRAPAVTAADAWWHYSIAEDVSVNVRGNVSPWRLRHIQAALAEFAARLGAGQNQEES
ncbi:MAG: helix-turn-helix domain-containing protein [Bryobacteraceae bacterium]